MGSFNFSRKKVVLVVDDDQEVRKMLTSVLRSGNYDVIEAENARDGLLKLSRHPEIDIGLVDITMPGMNGISFIGTIRRQEAYSRVPFIMVTVLNDKKHIIQAMKAGAQDYVVKPFDPKILIEKIENFLDADFSYL